MDINGRERIALEATIKERARIVAELRECARRSATNIPWVMAQQIEDGERLSLSTARPA